MKKCISLHAALLIAIFAMGIPPLTPYVDGAAPCIPKCAPATTFASGSTYSVTIIDLAFQPLHINITTGTTVTWTYSSAGQTIHTVTSDPGTNESQGSPLISSGTLSPGQSFSYTFDLPGFYPYQCQVHPNLAQMNGWVMVTGSPVTPPSSGPPSGSSFPWLMLGVVVTVVAVAAILIALTLVRRRKVPNS